MSDRPSPSVQDRRPAVGKPANDRTLWIFAAAALIGGGILFAALENHRAGLTAPAIAPGPDDAGPVLAPPADLALPQSWQTPSPVATFPVPGTASPVATVPSPPPVEQQRRFANEGPRYSTQPPTVTPPIPSAATASPSAPAEVFRAGPATPSGAAPKSDAVSDKSERVEATRFSNPATTVPKGTVMQAVLESALDSTRAGLARAIVSRDIYGFDGTKVLIPRGSRLIGEYKADVQRGQSRALIEWQRLMRPDGVVINLDSPSADPLGRAGLKGKVNSHFFARYGGAILQTALDIGEQVAVNKLAPGTTIYALPGLYGLQNATQALGQQATQSGQTVQSTLTVKQGTSVSVFVARDLDFTSVEP